MTEYDKNVFYATDKLGLTLVDSLDQPDLDYEFNTLIAIQHVESGRVFEAQSSGCSCPTPFEEYHFNGPDDTDMCEVTLNSFSGFETSTISWCKENHIPQHEMNSFIDNVKTALKTALKGK